MRGNLERNRTELLLPITHPLYYNKPNKKNRKLSVCVLASHLQCFHRKVMLLSTLKQRHRPVVIARYVILWFASLIIDIISQLSQLFSYQKNQLVLVYYEFQIWFMILVPWGEQLLHKAKIFWVGFHISLCMQIGTGVWPRKGGGQWSSLKSQLTEPRFVELLRSGTLWWRRQGCKVQLFFQVAICHQQSHLFILFVSSCINQKYLSTPQICYEGKPVGMWVSTHAVLIYIIQFS